MVKPGDTARPNDERKNSAASHFCVVCETWRLTDLLLSPDTYQTTT